MKEWNKTLDRWELFRIDFQIWILTKKTKIKLSNRLENVAIKTLSQCRQLWNLKELVVKMSLEKEGKLEALLNLHHCHTIIINYLLQGYLSPTLDKWEDRLLINLKESASKKRHLHLNIRYTIITKIKQCPIYQSLIGCLKEKIEWKKNISQPNWNNKWRKRLLILNRLVMHSEIRPKILQSLWVLEKIMQEDLRNLITTQTKRPFSAQKDLHHRFHLKH